MEPSIVDEDHQRPPFYVIAFFRSTSLVIVETLKIKKQKKNKNVLKCMLIRCLIFEYFPHTIHTIRKRTNPTTFFCAVF